MSGKRTVLVSISGGRTSGFMAWWMKQNPEAIADHVGADEVEYVYAFANTGMEHPDTLRFLRDIDEHFGLGIVWLEGVAQHGRRASTRHRVVDFDSAFRHDQFDDLAHPFHDHIRKYGIPNVKMMGCTREMKRNVLYSYMRSLGMKSMADYHTAIGIRFDERRRVAKRADIENIIYPLVDLEPVDKYDVLDWWKKRDWDLAIPEWLGNCVTCYKKSYKKLKAAHEDFPEAFAFTAAMERAYPRVGPEFSKPDFEASDRKFFRMGASTEKLIESFAVGGRARDYINIMGDAGCSESCELFDMTTEAEEV